MTLKEPAKSWGFAVAIARCQHDMNKWCSIYHQTPIRFLTWAPGEPGAREKCVHITHASKYNDISCHHGMIKSTACVKF